MDFKSGDYNCSAQIGPPIEDIQTEAIGFLAVSGETKVQLLPEPWPKDNLPPPTASLMSIASRAGLLAAAGPEGIILASTESLRKSFCDSQLQNGQIQRFEPQLKIPMNFRISQVAFSSDEKFLILSAEIGGGLAVYEVSSVMNGSQQSTFELSTNGKALRALMPNPAPEKAELLAIITIDGNLMVANLRDRNFIVGAQGFVLKECVSSMSWSTKGKQLVAGLGDGTACQMTPEGGLKTVIPRPPDNSTDHHISSILWLENHMFFSIYTPSSYDPNQAPHANLYLTTRTADCKNYTFQKITDPVQPFGLNRSPPHHFMLRLKDFPPNLQDIIIMASTASTDIGLMTRSKVPLTKDKPPEKICGVFTMTELSDDSRRAQLPFSAQLGDTSPIGFALDLSSRENVHRPIPGDEILESSSPAPALTLLNNEGVLSSWWVIYLDSVRQKTTYPGLALKSESNTTSLTKSSGPFGGAETLITTNNKSPFATQSFTSVLGAPRSTTVTGSSPQVTSGSIFGTSSALGAQKSAWGSSLGQNAFPSSTPEFGKPIFGSNQSTPSMTSLGAPTFGKPSIPKFGIQNSVWTNSTSDVSTKVMGTNAGNEEVTSVQRPLTFGVGETKIASSGFASFASKNEFGRLLNQSSTMESVLKNNSQSISSSNTSHNVDLIQNKEKTSTSIFGLGSTSGFVLGTTFKSDLPVDNHGSSIEPDKQYGLFGKGFANELISNAVLSDSNNTSEKTQDNSTEKLEDQKMDLSEPISNLSSNLTSAKMPLFPSLFGSQSIIKSSNSLNNEASKDTEDRINSTSQSKAAMNFRQTTLLGNSDIDTRNVLDRTVEQESPAEKTEIQGLDLASTTVKAKSKLNQELSPESSYEIIENNDVIETSKSENPTQPGLLFGEIRPCNEKDIVPSLSYDQITDSDKIKSPESYQNLKNSNVISQPLVCDEIDKDTDKTVITNPTNLVRESCDSHIEEFSLEKTAPNNEVEKKCDKDVNEVEKVFQAGAKAKEQVELNLEPEILAEKEAELKRHYDVVAEREAEEKRRNEIVAQRKVEEKLRNELIAQREAEEKRRNEIVALRKAEEKRHKELLARWEAEEKRREELKIQKDAEEKQAIIDSDDTCMQKFLASDFEPTTRLNDFVAHSDYVSTLTVESIPAQVEAVYRDINSMIDTLGINARSLHEFILGHTREQNTKKLCRNNLKDESIWTLGEIQSLTSIIDNELSYDLEKSHIKNFEEKLENCKELQKDLIKLRAKHVDIKKIIATNQDPNCIAIARAQPLGVKQATQQHELRRNFIKFQRLLSEAEEAIVVLKAKIVAHTAMNQKSNTPVGPTVEAVMRTITKLTNMAEKKSGDIDVLENQLRNLKINLSTSCIGYRETPTTPTNQHKFLHRNPAANSFSYGSFTPDHIKTSPNQNLFLSSVGSSGRQVSSSPRRTLTGYSAEEKARLRYLTDKKISVKNRLRQACQNLGVRVRVIDSDI
ncbi:putative nuclear pore complex subunit nup159 protein [Erysiphe necator]|uniref:Putative nuclear pore complex subunit nup159 protein n=1 Tax=Uncinula necator TaxID=52586 RepID=A0A0B1PDC4_UNCNE|nr:putative nuclear pore complex subunit nup159 protein [Erysiphe necator]